MDGDAALGVMTDVLTAGFDCVTPIPPGAGGWLGQQRRRSRSVSYTLAAQEPTTRKRRMPSDTMGARANDPRYQEKSFKEHAQATIRANHTVEIWATECPSREAMMTTETLLHNSYKGLWTKESHRRPI
jgi:hypothetical protein